MISYIQVSFKAGLTVANYKVIFEFLICLGYFSKWEMFLFVYV